MKEIKMEELFLKVFDLWDNQWLILTAGTSADHNMMTISWGSIGCMWNRPIVQVVVRPQRHTFGFMEKYDTFTVSAFPEEYRADMQLLGTTSGRDGDKLAQTGLTLIPSTHIPAPAYAQASLILECRKIYRQKMDPAGFMDAEIQTHYPHDDFHCIYFGGIISAKIKAD